MAKIMDKVLSFIGFDEEPSEEDQEKGEQYHEEEEERFLPSRRKGQVLSLHAQRQVRVVVTEPKNFEDVQVVADHLKNRHPVVVNLEQADAELARRVIDFISGVTYGLNGSMQKVGNGIFLAVPNNVTISSESRDQVKDGVFFPWIK